MLYPCRENTDTCLLTFPYTFLQLYILPLHLFHLSSETLMNKEVQGESTLISAHFSKLHQFHLVGVSVF